MKRAGTGLKIDAPRTSSKVQRFVASYLKSSGAVGLVIGLSGGLDSAVALHLCAKAVGAKNILGLVLPTEATPDEDVSDANEHARSLGVECKVIPIDPLLKVYAKLLPKADHKATGNLTARIRMNILYYFAAYRNSLVVGTSDKSEVWIGYFSKYGDGASDLAPLAGLYKTQLRELALFLGVPRSIVAKKSSPRLWPGQLAEEELGMDYHTIDPILHCLVDKKMKPRDAAKRYSLAFKNVRKVESMIKQSAHKRAVPPTLII